MENKMLNENKLIKLCVTAMMTALICVATMLVQIPMPLSGYVNLGDCFVLIAAWILGPVYGFAAGGIGSALADLFTGYAQYIPATFIIKGFMAVLAAVISKKLISKLEHRLPAYTVGALVAELLMVIGYYLYSVILFGGFTAGLASLAGNLVQGAFGFIAGIVFVQVIHRSGIMNRIGAYSA